METSDDAEPCSRFKRCPDCGQWIDRLDVDEVTYHLLTDGHRPAPVH